MERLDYYKDLIRIVTYHNYLYYNQCEPTLSDSEYDTLLNILKKHEKATKKVKANSPTQIVGSEFTPNPYD